MTCDKGGGGGVWRNVKLDEKWRGEGSQNYRKSVKSFMDSPLDRIHCILKNKRNILIKQDRPDQL